MPQRLTHDRAVLLEAESGAVLLPMEVARDDSASGGLYMWARRTDDGVTGLQAAQAYWRLQVEHAGRYYLWARVRTPSATSDSFFVRVDAEQGERLPRTAWHTGIRPSWTWVRVAPSGAREQWLELAQGRAVLEVGCREDGARLDALFLASSADETPTRRPGEG